MDLNKIKNMLIKAEKLSEIYESKLNLGFSGGKDSVVLKYFADYYGIKYEGNFNNTQIETFPMVRFIKENYKDINIVSPNKENSFFALMKKKGVPSIFRRWCCDALKHSNPKLNHYTVNVMGVRGEESRARMERGAVSVFGNSKRAKAKLIKLQKEIHTENFTIDCIKGKDKINIYPLFDLKENEIFDIIKSEKLIIPDVYYNGENRIGCAFCPFAPIKENYNTIKKQKNLTKAWIKTLRTVIKQQQQRRLYEQYKIDEIDLFYLYINHCLMSNESIKSGMSYLRNKNIFGETGYEAFKKYIYNE
ncbi:MAG: phosphoadenosine phosphosulfate reductase family protein [Clostridiaceae bacterium]|nr:phosphoadenosine phosphosulfate reductase family protein [Clostridiaceae bacterium]